MPCPWGATEIYAPDAGIGIGRHAAFHGIYKPSPFTKTLVQARIHTRPAQFVVQQIQAQVARVACIVCPCAYHDMRLVRFLMQDDFPGYSGRPVRPVAAFASAGCSG